MTDVRTFIKVHDGMPDHPKIYGLSDRAFRLLVTWWCWCSRHLTDGHIPAATWRKCGTARARAELLAAGLAQEGPDGVWMHDYLEHQRSAAEVEQIRTAHGEGGSLGNHVRWHVRRGVRRANCSHCNPDRDLAHDPDSARPRNGKVGRGRHAEQRANDNGKPSVNKPVGNPVDKALTGDNRSVAGSAVVGNRSQERSLTDRRTSPETTTETETDTGDLRSPHEDPSVDHHRPDRYARTRAREDRHPLGPVVAVELRRLTGKDISDEHASAVAHQVLDGRTVSDPRAYLVASLRGQPSAFLPSDHDPTRRSLTEALTDALPRQPCPHGAVRPERCPMCRRARPQPPSGPTTSISDEDASQTRTGDPARGPADGQADDTTDPEGDAAP
ncbi:hypothetical protein [Actinomadura litoris]|uniref:hypothetical protein n=1 Tax=Actinomadura litoris TaxID=2678616 RepID=UPI001FA78F92|nr:hypothetical protein [Actinomadura litoris]